MHARYVAGGPPDRSAMLKPQFSLPDLSVIIPVHGRQELLAKAITSLAKQTIPMNRFEVIVVDDGSPIPLAPFVDQLASEYDLCIRCVRQRRQGPGAARNRGVSAASAPWVALMDSDVEASPQWLAAGMRLIRQHPEFGAIEGKTVITECERCSVFTHQTENLRGGSYVTCNLFVKRQLCDFHPAYTAAYREDSDLAFSIMARGYTIGFCPDAIVRHPPLPARWTRPFALAWRAEFDPLLRRRFPADYAQRVDVHVVMGKRVARLRQKIYTGVIVFMLLDAVLWFLVLRTVPTPWPLKLILFLVSVALLVLLAGSTYVLARRTRLRLGNVGILLIAPVIGAILPWLFAAARLKGEIRFRNAKSYRPP